MVSNQPVTQPQDQIATSGQDVSFSVEATGSHLTYQWQKQEASGSWADFAGAHKATFTLNSVNKTSEGNYRVIVTDSHGAKVISSPATLSITLKGSVIWDFPTSSSILYTPFSAPITTSISGPMKESYTKRQERRLFMGISCVSIDSSWQSARMELVFSSDDFNVYALNAVNGAEKWRYSAGAEVNPAMQMEQSTSALIITTSMP